MSSVNTDVEYYLDGKNFKDFGVFVTASKGIVGGLERKESLIVNWETSHGLFRDTSNQFYKERTITLSCMIEGSGRLDFVRKVSTFFDLFGNKGTRRLKIEYDGEVKPLVYEVVLMSSSDVSKKWGANNDDKMVGLFELKLIEDEPVKRVFRYSATAVNSVVSITVTSKKVLNFYWGDGEASYNVRGTSKVIKHTYKKVGKYEIIVTGDIENIGSITGNVNTVWDILK